MPDASDPPPPERIEEAGPFTLANLITLARLCAVPATVWLVLKHEYQAAFLLFVAAGISDGIDGWLARRSHTRSALGAVLDPLADKSLLVSMYVTLALTGALPDWLAILVVFRDVLIVGGVLVLTWAGSRPQINPIRSSKANTVAQIALVAATLAMMAYGMPPPAVTTALVWIVTATTIVSGAAYVIGAARQPR
ncbi:CDP-alcohol phosphatidyltransferase family protein [Humitalea sp. 24SJ18S-53]|uniref:CDP-alcohol phosphatidyltransferase family protein n=1 Tax=Humitalea sp. 24SJ18S-53 TaxID=3422307 RepID=UPI003D67346C